MAVHLITGYRGTEHIQSKDTRSFNASMFGTGQLVMEIGNELEASITSNNNVRILDGDMLMQGGHIRIETGTYEDVAIETGTAGKNRNDLIVMTYKKDTATGIETAYLQVIKGTETDLTATDPEYVYGNLADGATFNQAPLYRVKIEGIYLKAVEPMFNTVPTYETLAKRYEAKFVQSCKDHLESLNVLDTKEEIEANTQTNQLAGALGVKAIETAMNYNLNNPTSHSKSKTDLFYINRFTNSTSESIYTYNNDTMCHISLFLYDTDHTFSENMEAFMARDIFYPKYPVYNIPIVISTRFGKKVSAVGHFRTDGLFLISANGAQNVPSVGEIAISFDYVLANPLRV